MWFPSNDYLNAVKKGATPLIMNADHSGVMYDSHSLNECIRGRWAPYRMHIKIMPEGQESRILKLSLVISKPDGMIDEIII